MIRKCVLLALALLVAAVLVSIVLQPSPPVGRVYPLVPVWRGALFHYATWAGRTVWVRADATLTGATQVTLSQTYDNPRGGNTTVGLYVSANVATPTYVLLLGRSLLARLPGLAGLEHARLYRIHISRSVPCLPAPSTCTLAQLQ